MGESKPPVVRDGGRPITGAGAIDASPKFWILRFQIKTEPETARGSSGTLVGPLGEPYLIHKNKLENRGYLFEAKNWYSLIKNRQRQSIYQK